MAQEIITLENLAAEIAKLRGELATWKALAIKQDRLNTAQMLAVNSGATAGKIAQIATNTSDIAALQQIASSAFRVVKVAQLPASGEPYIMYLVPQTDGETLNYCNEYLWIDNAWELVGTTGAMANNGELQIIVNGVTVGTFTANQATDSTASITVPTDTSQLTNGAGYVDATALATALASKQDSLSLTQLAAVNSGITSADVAQIGTNTTAIAGKQDALTTSQLSAVNSGITSADVTQIGTNTGNIATNSAAIVSLQGSKQNALSAAQLLAVNSGITSSLVTQIGTNQSDITTLNTALGQSLAPSADNTYSLGGASFRYANVYAVTFTGDLTGTASKAIADEDGTSIKTGYVNVAGNQTVTGSKDWTGINRFAGLTIKDSVALANGNYGQALTYRDNQDNRHAYIQPYKNTSGVVNLAIGVDNSGSVQLNSSLIPYATNVISLGSSSYQWSSVYAQTYYYNGTAWGLDKSNVWTAHQKIIGNNSRGVVSIYNPAYTKGSALSATDLSIGTIFMGDDGQTRLANSLGFVSTDLASNGAITILSLSAMENTASSTTRTNVVIQYDKNDAANPKKVSIGGTVQPNPDATFSLGTSTLRWKTLNGVNPGALSLPDKSKAISIDTTNLVYGSEFTFTPTVSGWLFVSVTNCTRASLKTGVGEYYFNQSSGIFRDTIPVIAGEQVVLLFVSTATSAPTVTLYPCLGNV